MSTVLQLLPTQSSPTTSTSGTSPTHDSLDGAELSVCLLDPVADEIPASDESFDSGNALHFSVYVLMQHRDQPATLIKLKLRFRSQPQTIYRLLSVCFQERIGARALASLAPSSITPSSLPVLLSSAPSMEPTSFRLFVDCSADASATTLKFADGDAASFESFDMYQAASIASPAIRSMINLAASVPFVGPITFAVAGIFDAHKLIKVRGSSVAKFLVFLGDVSVRLSEFLEQIQGTLRDEPDWKPNGSEELTQNLRESFMLVYSLTKRSVLSKFLKLNSTIALLVDKGSKLLECLTTVQQDLKLKVAELQLEPMIDTQAILASMKKDDGTLVAAIKELSSQRDAVSEANLVEIARLMDIKAEDFQSCMEELFEALTAEIVKQFDQDVGPCLLIDNLTFRYIWKNYLPGSDYASRDTFLLALKLYWRDKWKATSMYQSEFTEELFSASNVSAFMNVFDPDGSGKVCAPIIVFL